jgi:DNA-binding GntR family transcriptional regulator
LEAYGGMKLKKIPDLIRRPLREIIYETVRENILRGDLQGGDFFTDKDVAEIFKVSRMPVREAVQRLESEGYVERVPMKGNRVKGLSDRDVAHIYSMRKSLESLLMRYAAVRIDAEAMERLEAIVTEAEKLFAESGEARFFSKWLPMLQEFNDITFDACQFPQLADMVKTLREQVSRFNLVNNILMHRIGNSLQARIKLLQAFRDRDPDRAASVWCEHFDAMFTLWMRSIAGEPENRESINGTYIMGSFRLDGQKP